MVFAYVDSFLKAFELYYFDLKDSHKEQYLLYLSNKQELDAAQKTIDELKELSYQWSGDTEIALRYARGSG